MALPRSSKLLDEILAGQSTAWEHAKRLRDPNGRWKGGNLPPGSETFVVPADCTARNDRIRTMAAWESDGKISGAYCAPRHSYIVRFGDGEMVEEALEDYPSELLVARILLAIGAGFTVSTALWGDGVQTSLFYRQLLRQSKVIK